MLKRVFRVVLILAIVFTGAHFTWFSGVLSLAGQNAPIHEEGPAVFAALESNLQNQIAAGNYQAELCLYDFATGAWLQLGARQPLYPASMIKTLLLLTALEQAEQGTFLLDSPYQLKESDKYVGETRVTGTGILQYAAEGTLYTYEELLNLMISLSDNVATNIIFEKIGAANCTAMAQKLGLKNSAFTRKMYDLSSGLPANKATAYELTQMLVALENRKVAGEMLTGKGIAMMRATVDKGRIGRYLEGEAVVANKIGTVSGVVGDMALLYFADRPPLALTIVVQNPSDPEKAAALIGDLSQLIVVTLGA